MSLRRRLRVPVLLIAACAALLVFAATASAETRTGESTTAFHEGSPTPEATLVKGTASFDTATGSVVIAATTAAAPNPASSAGILTGLSTTECNSGVTSLEATFLSLIFNSPLLLIESPYASPTAVALTGSISAPQELPASKSVSGTTTTLSLTSGTFIEAGYKCAIIAATEAAGASLMAFPIKAPPPPPTPPAPVPAPAAFSIAKPKTQSLKVGKWKTVKLKVTNTGATASVEGSLRVKPVKGVNVKPETQKLPVLAPGASWSVSARVQLTAKAKKKSTLKLTSSATGATTGTGSLVLKLKE